MSREVEAVEDIRRLLAMTWRTWGDVALDSDSVSRTWSLDLGWLSPADSEELLAKLVAGGWLITSEDGLLPAVSLTDVEVPLGWFPKKSILNNPPIRRATETVDGGVDEKPSEKLPAKSAEQSSLTAESQPIGESHEAKKGVLQSEDSVLVAKWNIPVLLQSIAEVSKLPRQEVMRRARRKCNALGDITLWMALLLVAREQDIEITALLPANQ